jgi:hypothetical protein
LQIGEQGAGSREQGAGSREQGAGSREQGAGSREQGSHFDSKKLDNLFFGVPEIKS